MTVIRRVNAPTFSDRSTALVQKGTEIHGLETTIEVDAPVRLVMLDTAAIVESVASIMDNQFASMYTSDYMI